MDAKTRAMLNDAEQELLRETNKTALAKLDEDALLDLHVRVRRARTKYVKLHRRRAADQARKDGSRTRADAAGGPAAVKAEAFEEALGLVSARLAKVASDAAEALKKERLSAAAAVKTGGKAATTKKTASTRKVAKTTAKTASKTKGSSSSGAEKSKSRSPIEKKRTAATRSTTKKTQAKRDSKR